MPDERTPSAGSITIEIAGAPRPKGRPRFAKKTGHAYTDAKTESYENWVAQRAMECATPLRESPGAILFPEGPLKVSIWFNIHKPKAAPKREWHVSKRPDLDNLIKAILDGLNRAGLWSDDAQVSAIHARKMYASHGEHPGALVVVERMKRLVD